MKEQTPIRKAVALHYDEQKDKAAESDCHREGPCS